MPEQSLPKVGKYTFGVILKFVQNVGFWAIILAPEMLESQSKAHNIA